MRDVSYAVVRASVADRKPKIRAKAGRGPVEVFVPQEQVLREVSLRDLRFEVSVDTVDPRARYTVRVRADLTDGGVLLTTQSVPVLTRGAPDAVIVPAIRVS